MGDVEGWIQDPESIGRHLRPTIEGPRKMGVNCQQDHEKTHEQSAKLNPITKFLRVCLLMEDHTEIIEDLEACRRSLVDSVFLTTTYWGHWQHVDLDLEGTHEAMVTQHDSDRFGVGLPLGPYLRNGWILICEELQPLREKTAVFGVGLKGWEEDNILRALKRP